MSSVRPMLMVLYTSDAVEVRYSDGSRLHLLPCGTSFYFLSQRDAHPVHGMQAVQQRCRFVTSAYREQVLAALDFRNRFAERPYLCQELLEPDQVVPLYAEIKEVAWPRKISEEHCETRKDGSVCVMSKDEFASLILSPHRKDFTVCYLSRLSQEKARKVSNKNQSPQSQPHRDSVKQCASNRVTGLHDDYSRSKRHEKRITSETQPKGNIQTGSNSQPKFNLDLSGESRKSNSSDEMLEYNRCPDGVRDKQQRVVNNQSKKSSSNTDHMAEDLNISPITQASFADSPRALSNASGSPITPRDAVKDQDAKFRPFSTPTEGLEEGDPSCTPYGDTAVFHDYVSHKTKGQKARQEQNNGDGSFVNDNEQYGSKSKNQNTQYYSDRHYDKTSSAMNRRNECINTDGGNRQVNDGATNESKPFAAHDRKNTDHSNISNDGYHGERSGSQDLTMRSVGSGDEMRDGQTDTRCLYCWVTRHMSCDECPVTWSNVVKIARDVAEHGVKQGKLAEDQTLRRRQPDGSGHLRRLKRDNCSFSSPPVPLPLSCVGQHLHKAQTPRTLDDGKNPTEDPSAFTRGRLKVALIDGIIYRLVRLAATKCVEIYPGDGSVIVSQGPSAHFFQHIIPTDDKLEERTYSLKSPPPTTHSSAYCIHSVLKRAHRFLAHVRQEDTLPSGVCCWKHEETSLVEPLSTSMLEECSIPGYGSFSALSNGQVRIVFPDRTCLDMVCDFTRRVQACMDHSSDGQSQTMMALAGKTMGSCKLLLPNGQYQMVDIRQPGPYKRYVDVAQEWAEWVNSSPAQRQTFYQGRPGNMNACVETELQKINCFNYIVDKTVLRTTDSSTSDTNQGEHLKPYNSLTKPSILRNPSQARPTTGEHVQSGQPQRCVQIHSPPDIHRYRLNYSGSSASSSVIGQNANAVAPPTSVRLNPVGQSAPVSVQSKLSSLEGFAAVREALMRTSSVIKDIDNMLENK